MITSAGTTPRTSHHRSPGKRGMETSFHASLSRRSMVRCPWRCARRSNHIENSLDDPRRSSLKGRKRAIVSQSNIGTVSRETFGETSERRGRAHMGFSDHRDTYHLELNSISLAITASSKGGSSMAQSISVCEFIILLLRKEAR